jgi:membrane fusion protein, multidrug efflux system
MIERKQWLGRAIAVGILIGATVVVALGLLRLDARPRTHDGYLYADTAGLAPEVSGRIVKLAVRENQNVRKGDPLVEIDPEPFELRLHQARAQVEALRGQIDLTVRQIASQTSGANAVASQIGRARAQLELARDSRRRLEPMLEPGYVTEQQIDEARTNERTAEVALAAALQQANQARQGITDTQSLLAQLRGAEAAVALAERDLRNTVVRAPFDGKVVGLEIAEGTYAVSGHPLFTLIDTRHWYAVGDFRETELRQMHAGDPATVWVMADTGRPLKGRVDSLGWGVKPVNGGAPGLPAVNDWLKWVIVAQRFPVRVLLDDPPNDLVRIGATATVVVSHDRGR